MNNGWHGVHGDNMFLCYYVYFQQRIARIARIKIGNYILFDPKITKYHKNNTDPTPAPLPYMGGDCCAHMYFHWMLGVG